MHCKAEEEEAIEMWGASPEAARARELGKTAARHNDFMLAVRHYERAGGWQPEEMDNWSNLAVVTMETEAFREVSAVDRQFK